MGKQFIAVETAVENVVIGETYAYIHKGRLCVGEAIQHPTNKPGDGYTWAMKNLHTGKIQYPYAMDLIVPNSRLYEVEAKLALKGYETKNEK